MASRELDRPAGEVVRTLMTVQLEAARRAYFALLQGSDAEALHDLRVALRRARSLLRAYRSELRLRKRARRALRELAAATNPARDAEVLLELYSRLPLPASERARVGVAWVGTRLRDEVQTGASAAREALDAELERLCRHIERGLEVAAAGEARAPWRAALAARLDTAWAEFDAELQALRAEFTMVRAHRARIEAKRLRYLLEPARGLLDPAKALVEETKRLQTLLGDLHDAQVFGEWLMRVAETAGAQRARAELVRALDMRTDEPDAEADAMPGLVYLAKTVSRREQVLADQVRAWLAGGGASRLADAVRALREAL